MKNYSQTNYFNFSSVRESANRTEPKTEEKNRTVDVSSQKYGSRGRHQWKWKNLSFERAFFSAVGKREQKKDNLQTKPSFLQDETKLLTKISEQEISKLSISNATDLNQTTVFSSKNKAKFLRKKHAHLFGCQLWWFYFVWTNFALLMQFKCFWEAKFQFLKQYCFSHFHSFPHLSSNFDVLIKVWNSVICFLSVLSTSCFHDSRSLHPFRKMRAIVHRCIT